MKVLFLFISVLLLLAQSGCNTTEPDNREAFVNFDVEAAFQNDPVKLVLDDQVLLNSSITTNYTIDLAWSSWLKKLSSDSHSLTFSVLNYGVQKEFSVNTDFDTSTVLIRFNRDTEQISISQVKGLILRE